MPHAQAVRAEHRVRGAQAHRDPAAAEPLRRSRRAAAWQAARAGPAAATAGRAPPARRARPRRDALAVPGAVARGCSSRNRSRCSGRWRPRRSASRTGSPWRPAASVAAAARSGSSSATRRNIGQQVAAVHPLAGGLVQPSPPQRPAQLLAAWSSARLSSQVIAGPAGSPPGHGGDQRGDHRRQPDGRASAWRRGRGPQLRGHLLDRRDPVLRGPARPPRAWAGWSGSRRRPGRRPPCRRRARRLQPRGAEVEPDVDAGIALAHGAWIGPVHAGQQRTSQSR